MYTVSRYRTMDGRSIGSGSQKAMNEEYSNDRAEISPDRNNEVMEVSGMRVTNVSTKSTPGRKMGVRVRSEKKVFTLRKFKEQFASS